MQNIQNVLFPGPASLVASYMQQVPIVLIVAFIGVLFLLVLTFGRRWL